MIVATANRLGGIESKCRTGTEAEFLQYSSVHDQTAQQEQPSAPQKDLRSPIGSLLDHAAA